MIMKLRALDEETLYILIGKRMAYARVKDGTSPIFDTGDASRFDKADIQKRVQK